MKKVKAVAEKGLAVKENSAEVLISQAIAGKVSVETIERLLAMRTQLRQEFAKEEFDKAMSKFQRECPVIKKEKCVDFTSKRTGSRTKYNYASLDEIIRQVKNLVAENGFSYTIETENTKENITSIVKVKHISGHSEPTRFEVPIDKEAFMSAQQQYASASTFGKRYAFCNAFGILTGDEDNDGATNGGTEKPTTKPAKVKIEDATLTTKPEPTKRIPGKNKEVNKLLDNAPSVVKTDAEKELDLKNTIASVIIKNKFGVKQIRAVAGDIGGGDDKWEEWGDLSALDLLYNEVLKMERTKK